MKRLFTGSKSVSLSLEHHEDFARFYEQSYLSVFRYVMVLCAGNQAEAEDITADAFFHAWEKRAQFSGSASAGLGWVITIARNILIDHRRSENRQPVETTLDEDLSDPLTGVEALLVGKEQLQLVLDAISQLPFQQANIITLHLLFGWRINAIARHLGLAENTVSVVLRRSIARLQSKLAPQEIGPGSSK